jgi:hypothetical protein
MRRPAGDVGPFVPCCDRLRDDLEHGVDRRSSGHLPRLTAKIRRFSGLRATGRASTPGRASLGRARGRARRRLLRRRALPDAVVVALEADHRPRTRSARHARETNSWQEELAVEVIHDSSASSSASRGRPRRPVPLREHGRERVVE